MQSNNVSHQAVPTFYPVPNLSVETMRPVTPLMSMAGSLELTEHKRNDQAMRGLKGIAMHLGVPVMAAAAPDAAPLRRQRVHFEDL